MKNERTLIVDAYNVIYASDLLKHFMPKNKVRARESLAEKIKAIHSLESVRIMLVFDSSNERVEIEHPFGDRSFEFVFAPKSLTADGVIERILVRMRGGEQITVISNDNLVREATRSNGSVALRPQDLFDWIESSEKRLIELQRNRNQRKNPTLENRIEIDWASDLEGEASD